MTMRAMCGAMLLAATAGLARALPASMDRVPENALVTASIGDLGAFFDDIKALREAAGAGMLDLEALGAAETLLGTDGVNRNGPVSLAMLPGGEGEEPVLLMIAPIDDFEAFAAAMDAERSGPSATFEMQGETMHAKSIGGGFAAMSPDAAVLAAFAGEGGKLAHHKGLLGPAGARVADDVDTVIVANIQLLKPQLEQGLEGLKGQAQMMTMMMGPQAGDMEGQLKALDVVAEAFLRDATAGIIGIDAEAEGLALDLAAQFAEGSEIAGFFAAPGEPSRLMGRLPTMEFLLAGAADSSAPGIKKLYENMAALNAQMQPGGSPMDFTQLIQAGEGWAGVLGASPALMAGGLFSNSVIFIESGDPAAVKAQMREAYSAMDGQSVEGLTYRTSYDAGSVEIAGQKVDTWTIGMQVDPAHPQAMMMQQSMMMMLGPSMALSGYMAATDTGLVSTYSQNAQLMTNALNAARDGGGLGASPALEKVSAHLPDDRSAEVYIGTKTVLNYAKMVMAMMGGPTQLNVPDELDPVAMGISTNEGGFRLRTYLSAPVIETIGSLQGQGDGGDEGGGSSGPRF